MEVVNFKKAAVHIFPPNSHMDFIGVVSFQVSRMDREVHLAVYYLNKSIAFGAWLREPVIHIECINVWVFRKCYVGRCSSVDGLTDVGVSCSQATNSNKIGSKRMFIFFIVNVPFLTWCSKIKQKLNVLLFNFPKLTWWCFVADNKFHIKSINLNKKHICNMYWISFKCCKA